MSTTTDRLALQAIAEILQGINEPSKVVALAAEVAKIQLQRPDSCVALLEAAEAALEQYEDTVDLDANDVSTSGRVDSATMLALRAAIAAAKGAA
jgi:hypothetical protein